MDRMEKARKKRTKKLKMRQKKKMVAMQPLNTVTIAESQI
jgi:hypothetical protein